MRTQIWIIGSAFIGFGAVAWGFHTYSPAYVGLIVFGVGLIGLGALTPK